MEVFFFPPLLLIVIFLVSHEKKILELFVNGQLLHEPFVIMNRIVIIYVYSEILLFWSLYLGRLWIAICVALGFHCQFSSRGLGVICVRRCSTSDPSLNDLAHLALVSLTMVRLQSR